MTTGKFSKTEMSVAAALDKANSLAEELAKPVQEPVGAAPEWNAACNAMLQINDLEALLGGRNGPSIKLRKLVLRMAEDTKRLDFVEREYYRYLRGAFAHTDFFENTNSLRKAIDLKMKGQA